MVNFKRVLAVVLAATMVMAGSMTAFASQEEAPVGTATGNDTVNGTGTGEGHVNKKVMSMVLPTNVASVFNYTMDPERLIQATDHARYSDYTFPAAASDTGVYFLVDTKEYANAANKVTVINKGSIDATLTVSIKTDPTNASTTDIALLTAAPDSTATTAGLYLEAKIAGVTQAITTGSTDVVVKVPGNTNNYEIKYDATDGYTYEMKTSGLEAWKAVDIEVSGAVTNGIAVTSTTTAPKIVATWSFAVTTEDDEFTNGAAATNYSDTPTSYLSALTAAAGGDVALTVSAPTGVTISGVKIVKSDNTEVTAVADRHYTLSGTTLTLKSVSSAWSSVVVTFSDGHSDTVTVSGG